MSERWAATATSWQVTKGAASTGAADQTQDNDGGQVSISSRNERPRELVAKVLGFAKISGVGLALDVGLFVSLVGFGWPPSFANFVSAMTAVTFVYFVSTRHVFQYQGKFLVPLFLMYLAYQNVAVVAASWAVGTLAALGIEPVLAKGLILPFTFSANYLFLDILTRFRR